VVSKSTKFVSRSGWISVVYYDEIEDEFYTLNEVQKVYTFM